MKDTFIKLIPIVSMGCFGAAALSIPVFHETMTLWYKTGLDRTLLKSGQFAGMLAFLSLYLQVVLAVRGSLLDRIFGASLLTRLHRFNGMFLPIPVIAHVLLVLASEGLTNIPVGFKYWPEMLGASVLVLVVASVTITLVRNRIRLSYRWWRTLHRFAGYAALLLLSFHMLSVSDSFEKGFPRLFLIISVITLILWISVTKYHKRRK